MTIAGPDPQASPSAGRPVDSNNSADSNNSGATNTLRGPKPYYVNGWVDGLFIGGGSILCFLIMRYGADYGGWSTGRTTTVINFGIWLSWAVNWPHFAATSYRLYRSKETTAQYPITAFVVPLLLIPATIAALSMPDTFAPWYVKLFMVWSPYHFSGQTIGITILYARRAGFSMTPIMRWALTWFVFSTYIGLQAQSEVPGAVHSFYGITNIPTIGLPAWFATAAHYATIGLGLLLILAAYDAHIKAAAGSETGSSVRFPFIMAVPVITQLIWFKLAVGSLNTASFLEFVPLFHSIQYLFIAWFMQMKERQIARGREGSGSVVAIETVIWAAVIFVVGAFMFSWGPWVLAALFPVGIAVSTGVMQATVQIHHFFVDGVIWKLKNPRIRAALNTSIDELFHAPTDGDT